MLPLAHPYLMIARKGLQAGSLNEKYDFHSTGMFFHEEPERPCVMGRFQFVMITYESQSTTASAWETVS